MEDLKMNYSQMNNKEKNKEMIDKVMINKDMYNQEINVEENNSEVNYSDVNNFQMHNSEVNFEDFGVDDILDIYIPESSDNIESLNIDKDKDYKESRLNNVVFYKEDSDEVIIIRNDLKNKWNNRNSLPF